MNIEEAFLDKIWLVVNDGLPEGELMLSGNDQDKVEQILKEYHQAKLKNLALSGVGNWVRFEDDKPKLNNRYLIVWGNYPPETRTWQKEDKDKDFTGLRWLAIPKWK
jgi:hypothetical protein